MDSEEPRDNKKGGVGLEGRGGGGGGGYLAYTNSSACQNTSYWLAQQQQF